MKHNWVKLCVREGSMFHIMHLKCDICGYFFMKRYRKGLWSLSEVEAHVISPEELAVVDHIDCNLHLLQRTLILME